MPRNRIACLLAAAVAACAVPVASAPASPEDAPASFVIGDGYEAFFLGALDVRGAPGGWTLEGISLERSRAVARYFGRRGDAVTIVLAHPDETCPKAQRTLRFCLRVQDAAGRTDGLVRHLLKRVRDRESVFQWRADVPTPERAGWVPTVPEDGRPVAMLAEPTWDLPDAAALARFDAARKALEAGDRAAAVKAARDLANDSPLAAASLLRRSGDDAGAVTVLERGVPEGKPSGSVRRDEERALSLLLAGRAAEAGLLLGDDPARSCRLAALWTRAIQEGRAADVRRLAGSLLTDPEPARCVHLFRMRLAFSQHDDDALEAAGRAALDRLGPDDDLLFLWGRYWFKDFFNPASLRKAAYPWGLLARRNPRYPTLLGVYATAEVQSGGLDRDRTFGYLEAWKKDPTDTVAAFLAGVGMHYLREFEPSIPPLEAVYAAVPEEPRAGMYLAMAYYFTRRQAQAEQVLDAIRGYAYQEPDIHYCRSSVWRHKDLEVSRRELETFLDVMAEEGRFCFDPGKPARAREDLEALRRGEVPPVRLPNSEQEVLP